MSFKAISHEILQQICVHFSIPRPSSSRVRHVVGRFLVTVATRLNLTRNFGLRLRKTARVLTETAPMIMPVGESKAFTRYALYLYTGNIL